MVSKQTDFISDEKSNSATLQNDRQFVTIDLLWTGGWDSTFRLLQIILHEKKKVQPYYVIDPTRNSTGIEIQSRKILIQEIHSQYPHTELLILPTIYINIEAIKPDEEIREAYHTLKQYVPLGNQHEWLPRFCKQYQIFGMEMSTENGSTPDELWANARYLKNNFSDDPDTLSEKERLLYETSKVLYKYFRFPVIDYSKQDMFAKAKKNNWLPVLRKTWFCFQPLYLPLKGFVPCGNCVTCNYHKRIDFEWRIPFYSNWIQSIKKYKQRVSMIF